MCVYVGVLQQTKPRFKQNSPPATGRREKINRRQPSARLYLNNAHERKIIIRIKSKVFFSMFLLQLCSVFATILLFSSPLSARALGIYFCFVLLSIFYFFSFPLPTCLRDFFCFFNQFLLCLPSFLVAFFFIIISFNSSQFHRGV